MYIMNNSSMWCFVNMIERSLVYSINYTVHSSNENQRDVLFLKFIWQSALNVSDRSTVHHQEYLNTVYTQ